MNPPFEPEPWDVLVALASAAADGDAKAAAFLLMFSDWMAGQEVAEDAVSRFLGMRAMAARPPGTRYKLG